MRRPLLPLCFVAIVSLQSAVALAAKPLGSWPTFRGPDRSGVSRETGLLQQWPEAGPPLVWETEGAGRGYSSLAIADERIFTLGDAPTTADDDAEYLLAFDRQSGKPLWKAKIGPPWNSGQPNWQSSRSTPTVDDDSVYVVSPFGDLVCCDVAAGDERWRKQLKDDLGGKKGDGWGYSESVLVDGDRVVCTPGGERATMVALDKRNGDLIWQTVRPEDRGAGHASVVAAEIGPTRVYVQTTASGPLGVRASDGKLLWSYLIDKTTAVIPTPIVRDDLVFFSAGYGRGGALLRQVSRGDDEVEIEEIYPLNKALANKHGGVVLVGDYVYGDSEDKGIVFCAELMTGEVKWKERGPGSGSAAVTAADGCLYIHYADGVMALAKASPEEFTVLSSFRVPGSGDRPSWMHPVVVGGRLYVREQDRLLCYDVRERSNRD